MAHEADSNGFDHLFHPEMERMILGAILVSDPGADRVWDLLGVEDFSRRDYQTVYRRMQAMQRRGEEIDRITLAAELDQHGELRNIGGLTFICSLDDGMPQVSHPDRYAMRVREDSLRRQTIEACRALTLGLTSQSDDPARLLEEHRQRLARLSESGNGAMVDLLERIPRLAGYEIQTRYLVEGLIVERAVTLLTGSYGDGKSTFALALANAVAEGKPILGRDTIQRPVLILDRENGIDVVKDRMTRLRIQDDRHPIRVWGLWGDVNERQPPAPDAPELLAYARHFKPLIVWDSLVRFAGCDENSAQEMSRHMTLYRRLAAVGATCVILHHSSEKSESAANYRGSSDIPAAVDTAYHISRDDGTCAGDALARLLLKPYKTRISPGQPLRIEYHEGRFYPVDGSRPAERSPETALLELVGRFPGCSQRELLDHATRQGLTKHRAKEALEHALLQRILEVRRTRHNSPRYYLPETEAN